MVCLRKKNLYIISFVLLCALCVLLLPVELVQAAQQQAAEEGGYLASYQSTQPQESSSLSVMAYVFTLLMAFAVVLALAYLASRFLGQKMGGFQFAKSSKILETLPLGANRFIYVVEIAGKVLVLGVTNTQITLINEINDEIEIARLRTDAANVFSNDAFNRIFEKQVISLEQITRKFPNLFGSREKNDK
jgi:flagellar protein FliO/FliZ